VNRKKESDQAIAAELGKPLFIVQHILQVLEDAGHLMLSQARCVSRQLSPNSCAPSRFIQC